MKYKQHAFGLPEGTIRGLLTIILVLSVIVCGFLLIKMVKDLQVEQFKLAFGVFTVLNSLAFLMLGSYIKK